MGPRLFLLQKLLLDLFQPDELRQLIRLRVGEDTFSVLPGKIASADTLAYEVVVALHQRGLLQGPRFFDLLVEVRPHREADIGQVEEVFRARPPRIENEGDRKELPMTSSNLTPATIKAIETAASDQFGIPLRYAPERETAPKKPPQQTS